MKNEEDNLRLDYEVSKDFLYAVIGITVSLAFMIPNVEDQAHFSLVKSLLEILAIILIGVLFITSFTYTKLRKYNSPSNKKVKWL